MAITPRPFPTPTPFSAPINAGSADNNVPAVAGTSGFLAGTIVEFGGGTGVYGGSGTGVGVYGASGSGAGVYGHSTNGMAIVGVSQTQDAINGTSSSPQHAGVSANNNGGGFGLWAKAKTGGYFEGDGNFAIQAVCATDVDAVNVTSGSANHAAVSANNNGGGFGLWANSPNGIAIWGQGKVAGHFQGDVEVTGDVKLIGADCAEHFDVIDASVCDPGTVMVIDNTGVLVPSSQEYDRRVAGVVSGAGDLRPGLILDQKGDSTGRRPLALVGKVYCKVDATYGAIEVGDLLTTSPTPGHAMRADDSQKAFGAVIGKSLGRLGVGPGIVPILIALQ